MKQVAICAALAVTPLLALSQSGNAKRDFLLERAERLALKTPYNPPPGNALSHHAAGYAKVLCSAIFVTGLELGFAMENVGYFTAPYAERSLLGRPEVNGSEKSVTISLPDGQRRKAIHIGDLGCVTLPAGSDTLHFKPIRIERRLPPESSTPWPMGDLSSTDPIPGDIDMEKVRMAVDAAFGSPDAMTAAFVVTHKGRIIGERYGEGIGIRTPLESWSMGKSLSATIMGILIRKGVYSLEQKAPIPEWQGKGDPRASIRIRDIMQMSSGLFCRAPQDPDYDPGLGYPDHLYLYTGGVNSFSYAANLAQQWPPNTVGRYRNSDPVLINYLNRIGIGRLGEDYHGFPQKELFDRIGIRTMVMETDPYGNFLTQGYEFASARDWARLGNLYLQQGMWQGERILPADFVRFVKTVAEPWKADGRPIYGGLFWVNGDGARPIPKDAYMMLGAGGQSVTIIPSHELVVVRLGHFKGQKPGEAALMKAYGLLMQAVPARQNR